MEKQDSMPNQDSRSRESKPISMKENCTYDDRVSGRRRMNSNHADSVEVQSSVNLVSGNSGYNSISSPFSVQNASSTVDLGEKLKDHDVSTLSSNVVSSRVHSARSEVSSEAAPLTNRGTNGLDAGKSNGGLKYMTESSCSSSTLTVPPVCSSSESYQDMSTDVAPEHHVGNSSSSIPTGFDSSTAEPGSNHAVSDTAAQTAQKAVDSVRAQPQLKVSENIRNQNGLIYDAANSSISDLHEQRSDHGLSQDKQHYHEGDNALGTTKDPKCSKQKINIYHQASGSTSLDEEINTPPSHSSYVYFENPRNFSSLTETKGEAPSLKGEDCRASYQHIVHQESYKHQPFSSLQDQSKELNPPGIYGLKGLFCGEKSSESILARPADVVSKGNTARPDLFDLNEDIYSNESKSHVQSACETGYSCHVIRVVAKPGVPLSIPMTPPKFQGLKGFKGSAATSAFSPTHQKRSDMNGPANWSGRGPKHSEGFLGIDLNVVAAEDDTACESHLDAGRTTIPLIQDSSLKSCSSRAERHDIDLNCLSNSPDMFPSASLPVTSKTPMVDLNLNEDPSCADASYSVQQYNTSHHMARMASDSPAISFASNARDPELNFARPAYLPDFSSLQFYGQSQTRPFLVAAPNVLHPAEQMQKVVQLQPKLPYLIQTLPSQSYPSTGPFFFYPNGSVTPSVHYSSPVQDPRDSHVHNVLPQNINHGMLPTFGGAPHFVQVPQGKRQNEIANTRAFSNLVNGGNSVAKGSLRETRQYLYPSKCSTAEEQMRTTHPGILGASTPLKRTEPDGGHGTYQLTTRQLTTWN